MSGISCCNRERLWKEYSRIKTNKVREKLILEYSYLVKYVAGRLSIYLGNNVDYEDLISYGIFGLIDAIDKFDISKGVKFETYASLRIRGSIIDSLRKLDWVPRTLRQKSKQIEKTYVELENKFGRNPTDKEIAEKLNISVESYNKTLSDLNASHLISLEEFLEQNYESGVDLFNANKFESPAYYTEINEIKRILADDINKLPDKEKKVITLYYFEELTLKEISAIMNVSESRISQLHSKAVARLRNKLGMYKTIFY